MDRVILDKKVDSILRCLTRIEQRLPIDEETFLLDYDAQDVVVFSSVRLGFCMFTNKQIFTK